MSAIAKNMLCAGLRNRDQLASPAYGHASSTQFPGLHLEALAEQAQDPTQPARRHHDARPGLARG